MKTIQINIIITILLLLATSAVAQLPAGAVSNNRLSFIKNDGIITDENGRLTPGVQYFTEGNTFRLLITDNKLSYVMAEHQLAGLNDPTNADKFTAQSTVNMHRVDVVLGGANNFSNERVIPAGRTTTYHFGPGNAKTVNHYSELLYKDVYNDIDMRFYFTPEGDVKYDYLVTPRGNYQDIKLFYQGADSIKVDSQRIIIYTSTGEVYESMPVAYTSRITNVRGQRTRVYDTVSTTYMLNRDGSVSFNVGAYNTNKTLVIDPVVKWFNMLGAQNIDMGLATDFDSEGNAYMAGMTLSLPYINNLGPNQQLLFWNSYLAKYDPDGNPLAGHVFLSLGPDGVLDMHIDRQSDNVYLTGGTADPAYFNGNTNTGMGVWVHKFTKDFVLDWTQTVGGDMGDLATSIITKNDDVYISGTTASTNLPTKNASQSGHGGDNDAFIWKLDNFGNTQFLTYYGGSRRDDGNVIDVSENGQHIYLSGVTLGDLPNTSQLFYSHRALYVAKFTDAGLPDWTEIHNGSDHIFVSGITHDLDGEIYVTGHTQSTSGFSFGNNIYQANNQGLFDGYVFKIDQVGVPQYCTYVGSIGQDYMGAIGITASKMFLVGSTLSPFYINQNDIEEPFHSGLNGMGIGKHDGILLKLSLEAEPYRARYIGGTGYDYSFDLALGVNEILVTGMTNSRILGQVAKNYDAYLVKMEDDLCDLGPDIVSCDNQVFLHAPFTPDPPESNGQWSVTDPQQAPFVIFNPDEFAQDVTVEFAQPGIYELQWLFTENITDTFGNTTFFQCTDQIVIDYQSPNEFNTMVSDADCGVFPNGSIQLDLVFPTADLKRYALYGGNVNVLLQSTDFIAVNTHTFSNLTSGTYIVKVIGENGCTAQKIVEVGVVADPPEFCVNRLDCNGAEGPTDVHIFFTVYGQQNGSYTYRITENGTELYQSVADYNVEETDDFTYMPGKFYKFEIVQPNDCDPEPINIIPQVANLTTSHDDFWLRCFGDLRTDLEITTSFNGANCEDWEPSFHYELQQFNENTQTWDLYAQIDGGAMVTFEDLGADIGQYRTVTTVNHPDYDDCEAIGLFKIKESSLFVKVETEPAACFGGQNGLVEVTITGGFSPFTVKYFDADTDQLILENDPNQGQGEKLNLNLPPGNYYVEVYDINCYKQTPFVVEFTVGEPDPLGTPVVSANGCNMTAEINNVGGTPPYTVCWYKRDTVIEITYEDFGFGVVPVPTPKEIISLVDCNQGQVIGQDMVAQAPFEPKQDKHYYVIVTDANGCKEQSAEVKVDKYNGVRNFELCMQWRHGLLHEPKDNFNPDEQLFGQSQNMQQEIEEQIASCKLNVEQAVTADVAAKCQDVNTLVDEMNLEYPVHYMHYSLSYYDVAGRLVKTIPPNGVNPLIGNAVSRQNTPQHTYESIFNYNAVNNLTGISTPDGGEVKMVYNLIGQLRFEQDEKRATENAIRFYKYDQLNRLVHTGKAYLGAGYNDGLGNNFAIPDFDALVNQEVIMTDNAGFDVLPVEDRFPADNQQDFAENTRSIYNLPANGVTDQRFLRNRISYIERKTYHGDLSKTYFSYDPHGNTEWVEQQIPGLPGRYRTEYEFNLYNDLVTQITYQPGKREQFMYRYEYDSDNKLTDVFTSTDGYNWQKEADYDYYDHGPIRRVVIGEDRLQGCDFAYTIHGWIKGMNHPSFDAGNDPGQDNLPQDVSHLAISYYDGDFNHASNLYDNSSQIKENNINLYNSSITAMTLGYTDDQFNQQVFSHEYTYDWLNRLKTSTYYLKNNVNDNNWQNSQDYYTSYDYDPNGNLTQVTRNGFGAQQSLDQLSYNYIANTNKLGHIDDAISAPNNPADDLGDLHDQAPNNYNYDEVGNLVSDVESDITDIEWNLEDKVSAVYKSNGDVIRYAYDGMGNRIYKKVEPADQQAIDQKLDYYYARAVDGYLMTMYERSRVDNGNTEIHKIKAIEQCILGTEKLGLRKPNDTIISQIVPKMGGLTLSTTLSPDQSGIDYRTLSERSYTLNDHLGNVRNVIADYLVPQLNNNNNELPEEFYADVSSFTNYYPFGWGMPGLQGNSPDYRYGFNGMEKDDELKGSGSHYTSHYRQYDPRVGRWFTIDPKATASKSPYMAMDNNPIMFTDAMGDTARYSLGQVMKMDAEAQEYANKHSNLLANPGSQYVSFQEFMERVPSYVDKQEVLDIFLETGFEPRIKSIYTKDGRLFYVQILAPGYLKTHTSRFESKKYFEKHHQNIEPRFRDAIRLATMIYNRDFNHYVFEAGLTIEQAQQRIKFREQELKKAIASGMVEVSGVLTSVGGAAKSLSKYNPNKNKYRFDKPAPKNYKWDTIVEDAEPVIKYYGEKMYKWYLEFEKKQKKLNDKPDTMKD